MIIRRIGAMTKAACLTTVFKLYVLITAKSACKCAIMDCLEDEALMGEESAWPVISGVVFASWHVI